MPSSSWYSSVQCVHFGSIKRQNYLFMASTKKNCWNSMLSEGWKCYFRDLIVRNLPGCIPPGPPEQLAPSALVIVAAPSPPPPPHNKSNLATALLNTRETEHRWRKGVKWAHIHPQVYLLFFTSTPTRRSRRLMASGQLKSTKKIQSTFLVNRNVMEWGNGLFKFS